MEQPTGGRCPGTKDSISGVHTTNKHRQHSGCQSSGGSATHVHELHTHGTTTTSHGGRTGDAMHPQTYNIRAEKLGKTVENAVSEGGTASGAHISALHPVAGTPVR
uniref:Elongator complex protein 3 n=1 Tax=Lygus hesperus TaxID=30085 RepID=A0A0A9Y3H4_LYGHE